MIDLYSRIKSRHIVYFVLFFLITFLVFVPVIKDIDNIILGNLSSTNNAQDGFQNIWNLWWAKKNCLGFCGNLWQTDYQFYPGGTSLLFQTFAYPNLFFAYPFMLAGLSYVATYNLGMILAVFLAMITMYSLIYYLTKTKEASFLVGLSYGLSPFLIGHIFDGQTNLTNVFYFPLIIHLTLLTINSKRWSLPAISGFVLFLIAANDFIYLIFSMIIVGTIYVYHLLFKNEPKSPTIKRGLLTLLFFSIPFLVFFHKNITEYNKFNLDGPTVWNSQFCSVDLGAIASLPPHTIIGSKVVKTDYFKYTGIYSDKSIYYSIVLLVLAFFGLKRFSAKEKMFWLFAILVPMLLSFGPKLKLDKEILISWLPFQIIEKIPVINVLRNPSRLSILSLLTLSMLAGYGYLELTQGRRNKVKNFNHIFFIILFLIIFELFPFKVPTRTLEVPKAYEKIREEAGNFAVFEFPTLWMSGLENKGFLLANQLYYQTYHEKKMNSGYVTRMKDSDFYAYNDNPLLNLSISSKKGIFTGNIATELGNEYKYVIFHKERGESPYYNVPRVNIEQIVGDKLKAFYSDEDVNIYTIKEK